MPRAFLRIAVCLGVLTVLGGIEAPTRRRELAALQDSAGLKFDPEDLRALAAEGRRQRDFPARSEP